MITDQDDVARLLQITFGTPDDPRLTAIIQAAQATVEAEVGTLFDADSGIESTLSLRGERYVWLPRWPVTAITSIVDDGTALAVGDDVLWWPSGSLYNTAGYWGWGQQRLVVTYDAGWVTPPEPIRWLVARVAARLWQSGMGFAENQGAAGITQETVGAYSVTYGQIASDAAGAVELTETERRAARAWRRVHAGTVRT